MLIENGTLWCPTLGEENRLMVFENRVCRKIFGLKRVEIKGDWIKLVNEDSIISTLHHQLSA
jgi:hypothetical protein